MLLAPLREKLFVSSGTERILEFEQIVKRYQRPMIAIAYRMLGNLDDARDLSQEAFIRFWQTRAWPADERATFALLARILMNLCIDRLRWRRRHQLLFWGTGKVEPDPPSPNNPERAVNHGELKSVMESATARLKPRQKAVFVLRDIEGYSVRETAQMMDCSENNVLVNLHLARKNLRKWLAPYLKE